MHSIHARNLDIRVSVHSGSVILLALEMPHYLPA